MFQKFLNKIQLITPTILVYPCHQVAGSSTRGGNSLDSKYFPSPVGGARGGETGSHGGLPYENQECSSRFVGSATVPTATAGLAICALSAHLLITASPPFPGATGIFDNYGAGSAHTL